MKKMRLKYRWLLTGLSLGLSMLSLMGCRSETSSDLQNYIDRVKNKIPAPIEPVPEIKLYKHFTYSVADLRSPFLRFTNLEGEALASHKNTTGIHPIVNRPREVLESFSLDSLRMLGTLSKDGKLWALIKDSAQNIHRVLPGNYLGQNYGRVISISEDKINIVEMVPDGIGGWVERKVKVAIIVD